MKAAVLYEVDTPLRVEDVDLDSPKSMDDDCRWWDIEYRGETLDDKFPLMVIGGPWLAFLEKTEGIISFAIAFRRRIEFERIKGLVSG